MNFEGGTGVGGGVDGDAAFVFSDEGVADGEAEAGAFADGLGGEEGFEDAVADVGRDAQAVVGEERRISLARSCVRISSVGEAMASMASPALMAMLMMTCSRASIGLMRMMGMAGSRCFSILARLRRAWSKREDFEGLVNDVVEAGVLPFAAGVGEIGELGERCR